MGVRVFGGLTVLTHAFDTPIRSAISTWRSLTNLRCLTSRRNACLPAQLLDTLRPLLDAAKHRAQLHTHFVPVCHSGTIPPP